MALTPERPPTRSLLKATALRAGWWGLGWTVVGLLVGVIFMLAHVEFMAESGAKPPGYSDSSPWIYIFGVGGACFGLLLGVFTELLLRAWGRWRPQLLDLRVQCVAGAIAGGLVGALTSTLSLVVTGAVCGAMTPAVAAVLARLGGRRGR